MLQRHPELICSSYTHRSGTTRRCVWPGCPMYVHLIQDLPIYCIPNADTPLTLELGCRCGLAASDRMALTPLGLTDSGAPSACILQCTNWRLVEV